MICVFSKQLNPQHNPTRSVLALHKTHYALLIRHLFRAQAEMLVTATGAYALQIAANLSHDLYNIGRHM
jgi:hypothetical protein